MLCPEQFEFPDTTEVEAAHPSTVGELVRRDRLVISRGPHRFAIRRSSLVGVGAIDSAGCVRRVSASASRLAAIDARVFPLVDLWNDGPPLEESPTRALVVGLRGPRRPFALLVDTIDVARSDEPILPLDERALEIVVATRRAEDVLVFVAGRSFAWPRFEPFAPCGR